MTPDNKLNSQTIMNNTTIPEAAMALPGQRGHGGARTVQHSFKTYFLPCLLSLALCLAGTARAGLINEWTGDHYSSGNWVDDVGSVSAAATGSPQAVSAAFNSHAGVTMNGGYFVIPAGTAPAGLSNFTVVVVFKPTALGPFNGNYYGSIPLAAFDIGGAGQTDWGLSYGGYAGQSVVCGVGTQNATGNPNGDIQQRTPNLALNTVHAVAFQVSASALTVVTYADGVAIVTNNPVNITPRSSLNAVYVGGGTFVGNTWFPGQLAAIQVYNDATTDCVALTQNLLTTYATPAPITLPFSAGADPGHNAPVTIGIPASASASGSFTVTLTSDTPSVVASTSTDLFSGPNLKNGQPSHPRGGHRQRHRLRFGRRFGRDGRGRVGRVGAG